MILEFMRDDHRRCDEIYIESEKAALKKDWESASELFGEFKDSTLHHFSMEENALFPTFEQRTGMVQGPTQMMRMEHQQIRALLDRMDGAVVSKDEEQFLGMGESLLILLQQHNMKEEQMLYPSCDRVLGQDSKIMIDEMQAL